MTTGGGPGGGRGLTASTRVLLYSHTSGYMEEP